MGLGRVLGLGVVCEGWLAVVGACSTSIGGRDLVVCLRYRAFVQSLHPLGQMAHIVVLQMALTL